MNTTETGIAWKKFKNGEACSDHELQLLLEDIEVATRVLFERGGNQDVLTGLCMEEYAIRQFVFHRQFR